MQGFLRKGFPPAEGALGRAGEVGVLEHEGLDVDGARRDVLQQLPQRRAAALERQELQAARHEDGPRRALHLERGRAVEVRVVPARPTVRLLLVHANPTRPAVQQAAGACIHCGEGI